MFNKCLRVVFWAFILWVWCVVLTGYLHAQTQTTVTGVVFDPGGNLATSGYVEFDLQPQNGGVQFFIAGVGVLAPQSVQCGIDGTGHVKSQANLANPCLIWGNATISPANTTYTVVLAPGGNIANTVARQCINGATYDLSAPVFCGPVALNPQSAIIPVNALNANIIPGAAHVFTLGSSTFPYASAFIDNLTGVNFGGNPTFTGNVQVNGTFRVVGATTLSSLTVTGASSLSSVNGTYNSGSFNTVSAALAAALAASQRAVSASCATFNDNISIATSPLDLFGVSQVQNCSILQPLVPATDLYTIDATATGALSTTSFRNMTLLCPAGACGKAITITGSQAVNQPNDFLTFRNIYTPTSINSTGTAGFSGGFSITGRTIWSIYDNVRLNGTRGDGWNVTATGGLVGPNNANYHFNSQYFGNFGYGMRWNTSGGVTLSEGDTVINTNIESNGQNTALSPCAGALINGVYILSFGFSSFEGNCPSSADANAAHARITGTNPTVQFVNFIANDWNMTAGAAKYGIFADATRSGGLIAGNRFAGNAAGAAIHIAAGSMDSLWEIGVNQNMGKPDIVADGAGNMHVTAPAFGVLGTYTLMGPGTGCPSAGGVFDLVNTCLNSFPLNNLALNGAAGTWTNFTNGIIGQFLFIQSFLNNAYVLTNAAGGAGQMLMRDGLNFTFGAAGDYIAFRLDASGNWQETSRSVISRANTWTKLQTFNSAQLSATSPVINGTPTGTGISTATLKSGTGAGNYTSASTTYVRPDSTNLAYTVTIPTGWKLICHASGTALTITAAVQFGIALADGVADNTGILIETLPIASSATVGIPFALDWVVNGDGASHTINLQYKTTNGADSVLIANTTSTFKPTMTFLLTPSN